MRLNAWAIRQLRSIKHVQTIYAYAPQVGFQAYINGGINAADYDLYLGLF